MTRPAIRIVRTPPKGSPADLGGEPGRLQIRDEDDRTCGQVFEVHRDALIGALVGAPDWTARALVDHAIDDAEDHGRDGDPGRRLRDLQDLARRLARVMTAAQVRGALADWTGYADPGSTTLPEIAPPPCVAAGAACYVHARGGSRADETCQPFPRCPGKVRGKPCGAPLRFCRLDDPACLHCDRCPWSGDPRDPHPSRPAPSRRKPTR